MGDASQLSGSLNIEEKGAASEKQEEKTTDSAKPSNKVETEAKPNKTEKLSLGVEKKARLNFKMNEGGGPSNDGVNVKPKLNLKIPGHLDPKSNFKGFHNTKNAGIEVKGPMKSISELTGNKGQVQSSVKPSWGHNQSSDSPSIKPHWNQSKPNQKGQNQSSDSTSAKLPLNQASELTSAKPSWDSSSRANQRPQRERSFIKPQAKSNAKRPNGNIRREATFVNLNDSYKAPPGKEVDFRGKKQNQFGNKEKSFLRGSQSSDQVIREPNRRVSADVSSNHSDSPPSSNNNHRGSGSWRGKPSRELYKPPFPSDNLPEPSSPLTGPPSLGYPLNPSAKEFKPPSLQSSHSRDGTQNHRESREIQTHGEDMFDEGVSGRVGLTITVKGSQSNPVRKTKSLTNTSNLAYPELSELGNFPMDVQQNINRALEDPNRLSGRSVMDLVRQIFGRVVEGSRFAEPAARLCISIIERETRETFLESLLNTCQEWYHDRERLLRQSGDWPNNKWPAFITFLNEMYGLLKRKQLHLMTKYEGIPPKLVLLSLLAECCTATLNSPSLASVNETECLFIILTSVGRDLEQETPGRMSNLVACLRNAFLTSPATSQIRKTLLQLVELQAAGWQLPAQAVMYYYPGANM